MRTFQTNVASRYLLFAGIALLYWFQRMFSDYLEYGYDPEVDWLSRIDSSALLLAFLLGGAVAVAAGWTFLQECVENVRMRLEAPGIERDLLAVAARQEGEVTAGELALLSGRPLSAVADHLRTMESRGLLNSTIDDRGATVYSLPDMLAARGASRDTDSALTILPAVRATERAWR